jgi:hypothetical protein
MDGSPGTKVRPWTEVRRTKVQTYVRRAELSYRCGDGGQRRSSSQRNTTAMAGQRGATAMQARATTAYIAATLL